jgi:hypothetical protein
MKDFQTGQDEQVSHLRAQILSVQSQELPAVLLLQEWLRDFPAWAFRSHYSMEKSQGRSRRVRFAGAVDMLESQKLFHPDTRTRPIP